MRRCLALLPSIVLLAACEGATSLTSPAAPHAGVAVPTESVVLPSATSPVQFSTVTGSIEAPDCLPEPVVYSGTMRAVFKTDVGANGQPRMVANSSLQGATAVGAVTGTAYRVVQTNTSTSADFFAFDAPYTSNGSFRIITRGGAADFAYHFQTVYHMNANGQVTASFGTFTASCGGAPTRY